MMIDLKPGRALLQICFLNVASNFISAWDVPLAFFCEFDWLPCCRLGLASMQLAIYDANKRNGVLVPEFGALKRNITLSISSSVDPTDHAEALRVLRSSNVGTWFVAAIGPKFSSNVVALSHEVDVHGLSMVSWVMSPVFQDNPRYPNIFRLWPTATEGMHSLHLLCQRLGIVSIYMVFTPEDKWSMSWVSAMHGFCENAVDQPCTIYEAPLSVKFSDEEGTQVLDTIGASGVRTILCALATDADALEFQSRAYDAEMAGNAGLGYLTFLGYNYWTSGGRDVVWQGALLPQHISWHDSKLSILVEHWKRVVPSLEYFPMPGVSITADEAYDALTCLDVIAETYESVARTRLALENVNLTVSMHQSSNVQPDKSWWGSELRRAMQQPGVTMHGLARGPHNRKSSEVGLPWEESVLQWEIVNFVGIRTPARQAFVYIDGALVDGADLASIMLPGNRSGFYKNVGHTMPTACARDSDKCGFHGTCIETSNIKGRSAGWCKCDVGYGGRHCDISDPDPSGHPPTKSLVPSFAILGFGGLDEDGDHFTIKVEVSYRWRDDRFPYDEGLYEAMDTIAFDSLVWTPKTELTSAELAIKSRVLKAERNGSHVFLTVTELLHIKESMTANFQTFPFDWHKISVLFRVRAAGMEPHLASGERERLDERVAMDDHAWTPDWPLARDEAPQVVFVKPESFRLEFRVTRDFGVTIFRLLIPSVVLVMVSWGGFWIRPGALMPRFASGFISFLALQSFKNFALELMPRNGRIVGMSLLDTYISYVGIMLGLAVLETITANYVNESKSLIVSRYMDEHARWQFPFVFILGMIVMIVLKEHVIVTLVVTHVLLAVFTLCFYSWMYFQLYHFARFFLRISLKDDYTGALQYRQWILTEPELRCIFDELDRYSSASKYHVSREDLIQFIVKVKPHQGKYVRVIRRLAKHFFKDDPFLYPIFRNSFLEFITAFVVEINHVRCDPSASHTSINPESKKGDIETSDSEVRPTPPNILSDQSTGTLLCQFDEEDDEEREEYVVEETYFRLTGKPAKPAKSALKESPKSALKESIIGVERKSVELTTL